MDREIWKDIPDYEGLYQVSNLGRVKSLDRYVKHNTIGNKTHRQLKKSKILTPNLSKRGYHIVMMSKYGKHKTNQVHTLVAQAFIPNPENKRTVNHKNGIKIDNRVENLEWATIKENVDHAFRTGLYKNNKAILQIKNGKIINEFYSVGEAARQLVCCKQCLISVALGKRKSAYGYQWKYKEKED